MALTVLAVMAGAFLASSPGASASTHPMRYWALKWAEARAGAPYAWGGTGPGYDCSGLVMMAYLHVGFGLPHSTFSMLSSGRIYQIRARDRQQGDLAFFGSGHVELVTRHGTFGALNSGTRVGWHAITQWWHPSSYWRIK